MKTISDIVHINFQNTDVVILNAFLTTFYKLFYKNNRYIYFSIKNILFFFFRLNCVIKFTFIL